MGLIKAEIANTVTGARIPVLFNPEEYTFQKDNLFAQAGVPGLSAPVLQFVHGNAETLEMELFLDTYESGGDVRPLARRVTDLMNIDATTHAPPVLQFIWGPDSKFTDYSFTCVLLKVSQRYIMFRPDGTPVRARLQVTFQEYMNDELEAKELKRETTDYSRLYVVGQGETLSSIATQVYQNPALWRPIALTNRIANPRVLAVGQRLLIPQLPYRDPETGEVMQ
jgi:nucleoid-associated protein YgaU